MKRSKSLPAPSYAGSSTDTQARRILKKRNPIEEEVCQGLLLFKIDRRTVQRRMHILAYTKKTVGEGIVREIDLFMHLLKELGLVWREVEVLDVLARLESTGDKLRMLSDGLQCSSLSLGELRQEERTMNLTDKIIRYVSYIDNLVDLQQPEQTPPQQSDRTPPQQSDRTPPQQSDKTPPQQSDRTPLQQPEQTPLQQSDQTPLQKSDRTPLQKSDRTPPQQLDRTPLQQPERTPPLHSQQTPAIHTNQSLSSAEEDDLHSANNTRSEKLREEAGPRRYASSGCKSIRDLQSAADVETSTAQQEVSLTLLNPSGTRASQASGSRASQDLNTPERSNILARRSILETIPEQDQQDCRVPPSGDLRRRRSSKKVSICSKKVSIAEDLNCDYSDENNTSDPPDLGSPRRYHPREDGEHKLEDISQTPPLQPLFYPRLFLAFLVLELSLLFYYYICL